MNSIDKNDVDISKLFSWGTELTLRTSSGEPITIYLRIIGDAEINRARTYALRKSAELRAKLRDKDSDERKAFIPNIESIEKENLVELILALMMRDLGPRIRKEIEIPYPKEPRSDDNLEEFEKYQEEIDNYPKLVEETVEKKLREGVEKERKVLNKKPLKDLLVIYEKELINRLCETEMYNVFQDMCVFFSAYKDPEYKERLFENFEQFDNLPTQLKEKIAAKYSTMDLKIEDLKK